MYEETDLLVQIIASAVATRYTRLEAMIDAHVILCNDIELERENIECLLQKLRDLTAVTGECGTVSD